MTPPLCWRGCTGDYPVKDSCDDPPGSSLVPYTPYDEPMAWPACLDPPPPGPPTAVGRRGPSRPRRLAALWRRAGPGAGVPGRQAGAGLAGCPRPGTAGRRLGDRRTRWTGRRRPDALWSRPLQPKNWIYFTYYIQHCFICRPSDSTVPTDAGIERRTVATGALASKNCLTGFGVKIEMFEKV
jgi:hypothetical protein